MKERLTKNIELLAPARDAATAFAAIDHGADAVYIGPESFGARSQAGNSIAEIARVAEYAHQFGVKVYATVNTIIYDNELEKARRLCWDLWRAGVDALIVQDPALTQLHLPPIALHASTQCDTRTPSKARFLQSLGFTRIVLARELSAGEIQKIHREVDADLEVFVHGALCVSYSGDCQAGYILNGRSANRGECCQVCRFKFDLEDAHGNKIIRGKHLLSLKDMNRLNQLVSLMEAGATSLKIEGRLKEVTYVKNVVAAYRAELDRIIAASQAEDEMEESARRFKYRYTRASQGESEIRFSPDPSRSFNRGFTEYFLRDLQPAKGAQASFDTPKWIGREVGKVTGIGGQNRRRHRGDSSPAANGFLTADLYETLHNGDGLGYFTPDGQFRGFRLNRVEGNKLFPATMVEIATGTPLYRNADKNFDDLLSGETAVRKIALRFVLSISTNSQLLLTASDDYGTEIVVAEPIEIQPAKTPQTKRRRSELQKLGDTIYKCVKVEDRCGDVFIPASILSTLRRRAVEMLNVARKAAYRPEMPGKPESSEKIEFPSEVSRHDNIANRVAAKLFSQITGIAPGELPKAVEVVRPKGSEIQVMETRYCLRRELGACLKTPEGKALPSPLYLTSGGNRLRLDFDCANCRMKVIQTSRG